MRINLLIYSFKALSTISVITWPGTTPRYLRQPDENQTWAHEKRTETQNYDVHYLTPRPKFGFLQKPERVNFLKISTIITVLIFVLSIGGMLIYKSRKRRSFQQPVQISLHTQQSDAAILNFE